jgi:propionyl-CoA carboxylase beta chain
MANNEDKEAVKRQHAKGKLTARERINMLLDKNTFVELNELVELKSNNYNLQEKKKAGDGVITGYGKINNRPVCIYAQDFTFMGGSMGEMHNLKIASIMEHESRKVYMAWTLEELSSKTTH